MDLRLSASENRLCDRCEGLLHRSARMQFIERRNTEGDLCTIHAIHHGDGHSFFAAAEAGCRISCGLLSHHLRRQGSKEVGFYSSAYVRVNQKCTMSTIITVLHQKKHWQPFSQPTARLFISAEGPSYDKLLQGRPSSSLTESMDHATVFRTAEVWLSSCLTGDPIHTACRKKSDTCFQLGRLLCIGGNTVFLSLRPHRVSQEPYCALSYCWGEEPICLVLTASNEMDLCAAIDVRKLPKTIEDAIYVTRQLGINYLWVDCLCIIQQGDGGQDWRRQSSELDNIYSHCVLNLSADRAQSTSHGFLGKRQWPSLRPIFTTAKLGVDPSQPLTKCVITYFNAMSLALATEPLASRGWVLSERIFAPRTLHFAAGEMFWECESRQLDSESCLNGFGAYENSKTYAKYTLTISTIAEGHHKNWYDLLTNYSYLSLSHPTKDKLVALAGVSRFYEKVTGSALRAGISEASLPRSLLWYKPSHIQVRRPSPYRAPSWSWASTDGPLSFGPCHKYQLKLTDLTDVLNIWVKPVEKDNHLGQLEDGETTLRGPVVSMEDLKRPESRRLQPNMALHAFWDEPDSRSKNEVAFALILVAATNVDVGMQKGARAILITPSGDDGKWVRAGMLVIWFGTEGYLRSQEFLSGLELETVIII